MKICKLLIPTIILLFLITSVSAEKTTLKIGESYSDEDKNITLLKVEDQKALVCVNNQKGITAKNKRVDINGVSIELKKTYPDNSVKFDINIPNCYKCTCTGDCLNLQCQEQKQPTPQPEPNTTQQQNQAQNQQKTDIIEPTQVSIISIITVILIILIAILGIYILWKRIT